MILNPKLGLAAAALLLAGAGGAAFAHPHADGDGKRVERIIIMHDDKGGEHHAGARDRLRALAIHGKDGLIDCNGGEKIVDEVAGDDDKKTKVIICSKGAPTAIDAERLEGALARIAENDHLSDEQKARIETALRSAIDRARGTR